MGGYRCCDKSKDIKVQVTYDIKYADLNRLNKKFDLSKYANKEKRIIER